MLLDFTCLNGLYTNYKAARHVEDVTNGQVRKWLTEANMQLSY
jgi:hypothetical protein